MIHKVFEISNSTHEPQPKQARTALNKRKHKGLNIFSKPKFLKNKLTPEPKFEELPVQKPQIEQTHSLNLIPPALQEFSYPLFDQCSTTIQDSDWLDIPDFSNQPSNSPNMLSGFLETFCDENKDDFLTYSTSPSLYRFPQENDSTNSSWARNGYIEEFLYQQPMETFESTNNQEYVPPSQEDMSSSNSEFNQCILNKQQKYVDIKKGIFRQVRKFWKNYKKNHKSLNRFKTKFKEVMKNMEKQEQDEISASISQFSNCRARVKQFDHKHKELVWNCCYSYNNKVAKQFLEEKSLAFLFLIASKFIKMEIINNYGRFKKSYCDVIDEYDQIAKNAIEHRELFLKFVNDLKCL